MNIKINKKKLALTLGLILIFGGAYGYIYTKLHTNTPDDINDHTGKYIFNPDYKAFHKYDLVDLKSIYPTKLAYDPEWFKLPSDKYVPKEQPIPKQIKNISDPKIRREAYFNFLCKTESTLYITDINSYKNYNYYESEGGILQLNNYMFMQKIKNPDKYIGREANSNPFIFPIYHEVTRIIDTNDVYDFFYRRINDEKDERLHYNYKKDGFSEVMSDNGDIYQIKFDKESSKFLPLKKMEKSEARFYIIERPIEREEMRNLGIYGIDIIIFDRQTNKLSSYSRRFHLGTLKGWIEPHELTEFSWVKINTCGTNPHIIDNFE